jgi:hypothetical protein
MENQIEEKKKLYFAEPKMFSGKFHIFGDGSLRSLCGRWMEIGFKEEDKVYVKGTEKLQKGDCKSCFKKANLNIPELNLETKDDDEE